MANRLVLTLFLISQWAQLASGLHDLNPELAAKLTTDFQEFSNNCSYEEEEKFFNTLSKTKFDRLPKLIDDNKSTKYNRICNRFKYLTCERREKESGRCVCRKETFLENNTQICRLKQNVTHSCRHSILAPRWIQEPVQLFQIAYKSLNLPTLNPTENTFCDDYSNSYVCCKSTAKSAESCDKEKKNMSCATEKDKFINDLEAIRKNINQSLWRRAGESCSDVDQKDYLKDGKVKFSIDVARLNDTIRGPKILKLCNISAGHVCHQNVCSCGEETMNVSNVCKEKEGGVCSRYYWHDGDWIEDIDKESCGPGLECLQARDKINYICCFPNNTVTGMGRCRCNEMTPFLRIVSKNNSFVKCGSPAKYVNKMMTSTPIVLAYLISTIT